jgi:organic hydroperoxide reductase OsmC/OhrA
MDTAAIAHALQRAEKAFQRKPALALHDDTPATVVFGDGLIGRVDGADGVPLCTDMPVGMGGDGAGPTPGWLMRAGLASCLGTAIAMRAACLGLVLRRLEVTASGRSDARGLLGDGPVGPLELGLRVHIEADGVPAERLRELVAWADAHSPVSDALRRPVALGLRVVTPGD